MITTVRERLGVNVADVAVHSRFTNRNSSAIPNPRWPVDPLPTLAPSTCTDEGVNHGAAKAWTDLVYCGTEITVAFRNAIDVER
jgi:hypothetical protein